MSSYDPNSSDTLFSRILIRLDKQDESTIAHRTELKEFMTEMRGELARHSAKHDAADREKWYQRGFVAAITVSISAAWAWFTSGHAK